MKLLLAPALLALALFAGHVAAKFEKFTYIDGVTWAPETPSWVFLGKFCYMTSGGQFQVTVQTQTPEQKKQTFCFYSDWEGQWPLVYNHRQGLTCKEKLSKAARCINITQIDLWFDGFYDLTIKSKIPRWWFVIISNCYQGNLGELPMGSNSTEAGAEKEGLGFGMPVMLQEAEIRYLNPNKNNEKWLMHFSKDMQSVPQQTIAYLIIYIGILLVLVRAKVVAKTRGVSYEILRMLAICVACTTTSMLLLIIHFSRYDNDGQGLPGLEIMSYVLFGAGQALFIGILIDISRGYTISTNFLANRRLTYAALGMYMVLHITIYIWDKTVTDPATVVYLYESTPGIFLIILRVCILLAMLKNYYETIEYEQKAGRKQFYRTMAIFTSCVMLSMPFTTLIALEMPSWDRAKTMFAVNNGFEIASYLILTYIFRPWEGNRFISILDPLDTVAFGSNNMQVFPEANRAFDGL